MVSLEFAVGFRVAVGTGRLGAADARAQRNQLVFD